MNAAAEVIYDLVDPTANLIFGAVIDPSLSGQVSMQHIVHYTSYLALSMKSCINVYVVYMGVLATLSPFIYPLKPSVLAGRDESVNWRMFI